MSDILISLRIKGFSTYVLTIASLMMFLLVTIDLVVDFCLGTFKPENLLWQDIPIDLLMSISVALCGWFFYGKRLKLKSNIIELNLNEENGKKEK